MITAWRRSQSAGCGTNHREAKDAVVAVVNESFHKALPLIGALGPILQSSVVLESGEGRAARIDRAARPDRAHDAGRPPDHPDPYRATAHAQSACAVFGAGILDLDVGPDGRSARSATVDHRACGRESLVPTGRCQAARVNGALKVLS